MGGDGGKNRDSVGKDHNLDQHIQAKYVPYAISNKEL